MATAVKNSSDATTSPNPHTRLVVASVVGAVFVAACIAIVTMLVPVLWKNALVALGLLDKLDTALSPFQLGGQAFLQLASAVGLIILGVALAGPNPPEGTRGGVFLLLAAVALTYLVTIWIGGLLRQYIFKVDDSMVGLAVMTAIGVAILGAGIYYLLTPKFADLAVTVDNQGWFRVKAYKVSQGRLVRRLTLVGLLILAATGIWSLKATGHWRPHIPFTGGRYLPLLNDLRYSLPLVLGAAAVWLSWRAVNFPTFADFLIATEAEMNKVSWTNRKRLVQDTIVVLVTVLLFTIFLLTIDQMWGFVMTQFGFVPKPVPKATTDASQEQLPY
ncbi:MAG: preprotein translocase subunit SecE [Gemmataceae bacterium]